MNRHTGSYVWPVLVTAVLHTGAFVYTWPFIMDDALITYRYARHVGEGLGPFWNVASSLRPVEGYSSFLHMFLLGALHAATAIDVVVLGKTLGLACALGTVVAIGWQARRAGLSTVGVLVAVSPFLLPPMMMATASGMETPLYVLLAWAAPMACLRVLEAPAGRAPVSAMVILLFLATLTRPEFAGVAAGLIALVAWRKPEIRRQLVMAVLLWYVVPGLAVTGWRLATYGDVVPNTFYVKQRLPGLWGLGYVRRFLLISAAPYLLIAAPSLRRLWRERRDLVLVVLVSAGLSCMYFTSVRPLMGWWYRFLIPQLPLLAWLAAVAVAPPAASPSRVGTGLRWAGAALFVVFALAQIPPIVQFIPVRYADDMRLGEVGRRLRPLAAPDRSLSYYDIGRLPYEAEWTVVDVVGLTTSRHDLKGDCGNATDLLLRSLTSEPASPLREIDNPCPKMYETLIDLEFLAELPRYSRRMRIFSRRDLPYREAVRKALAEGWPAPYLHDGGWLTTYSDAVDRWFGP